MSEAIAGMWKDVGVNIKVEVIEYSVRAQKGREKSFKGLWWSDPTSTLGDPDGMMWRLLGPGGPMDYWRDAKFDELGNAARFSVDEKFRGEAYREITKVFLENLPWIPVIQPYEDYGMQKYVEFTPNPNQQFEVAASTLSSAAPSGPTRRPGARSRDPGPSGAARLRPEAQPFISRAPEKVLRSPWCLCLISG